MFNLREEIQFTEEMPGAVAVQGSFSKDEGLIECHPFFLSFLKRMGAAIESALVLKKDGTWRMCFYYRKRNAATMFSKYPIPIIEDRHFWMRCELR